MDTQEQQANGNLAPTLSGASPEQKFTPEQISQWRRFEKVRSSGRYNMFDSRARQATHLSAEQYTFVMQNFSELKAAALGMPQDNAVSK